MTVFLIIVCVGVAMAVLPPLVFGAGEGDRPNQPFFPPLIGVAVAVIGAVGLVFAWFRRRGS